MKKINLLFGSLLAMALTAACTSESEPTAEPLSAQPENSEVTVDAALQRLDRFMEAAGFNVATRGESARPDSRNVEVFTDAAATRADGGRALAYVVNFDEGGYAILGADTRQAPVIALTQTGSMTAGDLLEARRAVEAGEKTDAPTRMNASIVNYLAACATQPAAPAAEPRGFNILEQQNSLTKTLWSPDEISNMSRTKIELAQMMVYVAQTLRIYKEFIDETVYNWSLICTTSEYAHLKQVPGAGADAHIMLQNLIHANVHDQSASILADASALLKKNNLTTTVVTVNESLCRDMIFQRQRPTIACYDGMTMQTEGWLMDGWLKTSTNGVVSTMVYCKFAKDYNGTDNGYFEINAINSGVNFTQKMLSY